MSKDPSALKYMGTQSQETVNMAAALARATEQAGDQTADGRAGKVDKASSSVADAGSRISAAANWAVDRAKDTASGGGRFGSASMNGRREPRSRAAPGTTPSERSSSPREQVRC